MLRAALLLFFGLSGRGLLAADSGQWVVEQMPGGTVSAKDGVIEIADAGGCTLWYREKLTTPVVISYEVTVVSAGGLRDRVSDLNCFWMATDPKAPEGCPFASGHGRTGRFEDYDTLRTYYVGLGGNENTTTRFRRYAGDGTKPLLPEHDLRDKKFLLQSNRSYHIEISVRDGTIEYRRDGEMLFFWRDPAPFTAGWFGFRTVHSHQLIRNFRISPPPMSRNK
jgi:hypothetical protein